MNHYDVFISYSVKNSDTAFQLVDCLEKHGLKCWIAPRNISQGSSWAEEIDRAIENSENFVIIYSKETEESKQVPKEVILASSAQKRMIPFKIDEAELSGIYKYHLSDCQIVDACGQATVKMEELAETLQQMKASLEQLRAERKEDELRHKKKNRRKYIFLSGIAVIVLIIVFFVICGTLASDYHNYDPYAETMIFTANENMTLKGFEQDKELLRGRLEILFGKEFKIEEDAENFRIKVSVPIERISEYDVSILLEDYLTIPGELYISNPEDELVDYLLISRDEIEKVDVCYGNVSDLDLSEYGIEEQDNYSYIEVEVSNHLAETIKDKMQKWQGICVLSDIELANQNNIIEDDMRIIMNKFYENDVAAVIEEGKKICFYLPNSSENINCLMEHILEEEPMTQSFAYYYSVPTIWETKKDSFAYGKHQKSVESMTGVTIDVVYDVYDGEDDLTEGQWMDIRNDWKNRLDCLEIPYAFGTSTKGKETITVRFPLDKVNGELLNLLAVDRLTDFSYSVSVRGLPQSISFDSDFSDFSYENEKDGYYIAKMKIIDRGTGEVRSDISSECVEIAINTFLLGEGVPVICGRLEQGTVLFDQTPLDKTEKLSKKALPFLNMLSYIVNDANKYQYYKYNDNETKIVLRGFKEAQRMERGELKYGLTYSKTEQDLAVLAKKMSENRELEILNPQIAIKANGDCVISMKVKTGDSFARDVADYTKYLLKDCDLEKRKHVRLYFTEEADGERARIIYERSDITQNDTSLTCVFYGDRIDRHQKALQEEFAGDEYLRNLGYRFELNLGNGW